MLLLAALITWIALARTLSPLGFVQTQLFRLSFWSRDEVRAHFNELLRRTPFKQVSRETIMASEELARRARDAARGIPPTAESLRACAGWASQDADNGLSRLYRASLAADAARRESAAPAAIGTTFERCLSGDAPARQWSTYERAQAEQYRDALRPLLRRAELAMLLVPDEFAGEQYETLPWAVNGAIRLARELDAAGDTGSAERCRLGALGVPAGLLRGDPPPCAALLYADLLARLAESATATAPASAGAGAARVDEPASAAPERTARPAADVGRIDWWAIGDEARRFRSDVRACWSGNGLDLLDRQPMAGGAASVRAWMLAWIILSLCATGTAIGIGCPLRAAWLALRTIRSTAEAPRDGLTMNRAMGAALATCVAVAAGGWMVWMRFDAGRIGMMEWPMIAAAMTMLAAMMIGHGMIGSPVADADGDIRRRVQRGWLAGGAAAFLPLFVAPEKIAAITHDIQGRPALGIGAAGLLVAVGGLFLWLGLRRRSHGPETRGIGRAAIAPVIRPDARNVLRGGATVWFATAVAALASSFLLSAADREWAARAERDHARVSALVGDDWLNRYFAAAGRAVATTDRN